MASYPFPGNDGSRRSKRRVYDESEAFSDEESSAVSSITRQTFPNQQQPIMKRPERSDVEDGVPVEAPLETKGSSTRTQYSERPSFRERLAPHGQRFKSFCGTNKRLIITAGIGLLLIVIVVVISVTVSGRNTNQESAAPVPERDQELLEIMSTISSSESLSDPSSPQYMAKLWMIEEDPLQLTPSDTVSDERILQRYSLAVFYFATGGPESWDPNSWLQGEPCSGSFWIGLSCNDSDEVRAIAFGK